jgi:hypothetical protein
MNGLSALGVSPYSVLNNCELREKLVLAWYHLNPQTIEKGVENFVSRVDESIVGRYGLVVIGLCDCCITDCNCVR